MWPAASLPECRGWYSIRTLVDQSRESVRELSGISELSRIKTWNCESFLCPLSPSLIPASLRCDIPVAACLTVCCMASHRFHASVPSSFLWFCWYFVTSWDMTTCGTLYHHCKLLYLSICFIAMPSLLIQLKLSKLVAASCSFHGFVLLCKQIYFQRKITVKSVLSAPSFFPCENKYSFLNIFAYFLSQLGTFFPMKLYSSGQNMKFWPGKLFPCVVFVCIE